MDIILARKMLWK